MTVNGGNLDIREIVITYKVKGNGKWVGTVGDWRDDLGPRELSRLQRSLETIPSELQVELLRSAKRAGSWEIEAGLTDSDGCGCAVGCGR